MIVIDSIILLPTFLKARRSKTLNPGIKLKMKYRCPYQNKNRQLNIYINNNVYIMIKEISKNNLCQLFGGRPVWDKKCQECLMI